MEETYELCKKIYNENIQTIDNLAGYEYIGLRCEERERAIGELCEYSIHTVTKEKLDGTIVWNLSEEVTSPPPFIQKEDDVPLHCYVVAGNTLGRTSHLPLDTNELVIKGALVIAKIF
ncbi:MAG: hypothetical protein ABF649_19820 [Bacillus sp. (in: firmicutes)]